jgi:hypothetical protein
VIAAASRAILPDRADIGETGRPGAAFSQVRIEYLAQQFGHAAALALGARLQGFVLPVLKEYLGALHVLHHTQQSDEVKADEWFARVGTTGPHVMPIRRHDVHVCLVSEQATPNFIPVLDARFRPREVILVVSPQMRERARWLKEALAHRVERVSEHVIGDAWDIPRIHEALLDLVAAREGTDLALNVTGGTKPMAIAAQQVFHAENLPIFYVHPARNEIVPLFADEPPFAIEERVALADFLAIHGFR